MRVTLGSVSVGGSGIHSPYSGQICCNITKDTGIVFSVKLHSHYGGHFLLEIPSSSHLSVRG